jgi:hypothetical protein
MLNKASLPKFDPFPGLAWTAIPNAAFTLESRGKISGLLQFLLIGKILSKTVSHPDRPEWACGLTAPALRRELGAKGDEGYSIIGIELALGDLAERGMIEREKDGRSWKYKVTPERWETAPKYEKKIEKPAPEPEVEAEDDPAPAARKLRNGRMLVIRPGLAARPITLREAVSKVEITSTAPNVRLEHEELDGVFCVNIIGAEAPDRHTAVSASDTAKKPDRHTAVSASDTAKKPDRHTAVSASADTDTDSKVLSAPRGAKKPDELATFLTARISPILGSPPPPAILEKVRRQLNGTPLEFLDARIKTRLKSITSYGILPQLAKDASEAFHALEATRPAPAAPQGPDRAPRWDGEGSWDGDRSHWEELTEQQRAFYRAMYHIETAGLDGGRA